MKYTGQPTIDNGMRVYVDVVEYPLNEDQPVYLEAGLHHNLFDYSVFVIVPKSGQLSPPARVVFCIMTRCLTTTTASHVPSCLPAWAVIANDYVQDPKT